MSSKQTVADQECPVCGRKFSSSAIEVHVNKCIFLNTKEEVAPKRKRTPSPSLINKPSTSSSSSSNSNNITASSFSSKQHEISSTQQVNSPTKKVKSNDEPSFSFITPLAKQVQPKSLNDFVGQDHVFGPNSILRTLFEKGEIPNMILWGPPGCGKVRI